MVFDLPFLLGLTLTVDDSLNDMESHSSLARTEECGHLTMLLV